ncbi:hypothetical protein [Vacuolonema iberomarrocanum]|uniref:hypothetical protein n=1 Tax=Vacuolonema iberomarrocanum TaxID=3454632 RepID=UPI0019F4FC27|nr:hypothetical protein [filamentous cyanobacterium LEGE 07170]
MADPMLGTTCSVNVQDTDPYDGSIVHPPAEDSKIAKHPNLLQCDRHPRYWARKMTGRSPHKTSQEIYPKNIHSSENFKPSSLSYFGLINLISDQKIELQD